MMIHFRSDSLLRSPKNGAYRPTWCIPLSKFFIYNYTYISTYMCKVHESESVTVDLFHTSMIPLTFISPDFSMFSWHISGTSLALWHYRVDPCPPGRPRSEPPRLSEKLLAHGPLHGAGDSDADSAEPEPLVDLAVAGLQMRKAWTIGLQEASLLHRNRAWLGGVGRVEMW